MKQKVLILSGGISKERLISLDTGLQVAKELKKNGYKIKISEPDKSLEKTIKNFKPSVIFNALHGQFGEDGYIQSILERLKIPYTHSGVISSYNAMNKAISKKIFVENRIKTPKYFLIKKNEFQKNIVKRILKSKKINFPIVVKPTNEGSSLGVIICKNLEKLLKSLKYLFKNYDELILEEFIGGQEVQVAVINGNPLGAIELVPKRLFYDYKAKYSKKANTKHIMPARLTKKKYKEILSIAKKTHHVLKCKGVTRSDFKFYKNNFYLLEINTQPGMTSLSLVPEIASYTGLNFENLVEKILLDASINR